MLGRKSKEKLCPMLKKPCIEHDCMWFVQIRGNHPQTGETVDEWDCAVVWQPLLLIENSAQQRSTGAAVESFRNEIVQANETSQQILAAAINQSKDADYHFIKGPDGKAVRVYGEKQPCD